MVESESKRLGVKIYGGQAAAGNIIVVQRGSKHNQVKTFMGKDHTFTCKVDGVVKIQKKEKTNLMYL